MMASRWSLRQALFVVKFSSGLLVALIGFESFSFAEAADNPADSKDEKLQENFTQSPGTKKHIKRAPASYMMAEARDSMKSFNRLGVLNPLGSMDDLVRPPQAPSLWTPGRFQASDSLSGDSISPTFKNSSAEAPLLIYSPPQAELLRFPTPSF